MRKHRLALGLGSVLLTLIFLPATALAAAGGNSAGTSHTPALVISLGNGIRVTLNTSKAVCRTVKSGPDGTKHCAVTQRLPLSDLNAAARAERSKDMLRLLSRSSAARARSAAAVAPTEPEQCGFSQTEFVQSVTTDPDRFTSCSDLLLVAVNYTFMTTPPFFTVDGTFFWEDQQWESYSASSGDFTHGMVTLGYKIGATGNLSRGVTADLMSSCDIFASICSATSLLVPDPQPALITPGGTNNFGWTESDAGPSSTTPNTDNIMNPDLGIFWEDISTTPPMPKSDIGILTGRCDTMVTRADGCVNEDFTPTVVYDAQANPLVGPVAQHIFNAQKTLSIAWGIPKLFAGNGEVLNRDVNPRDIRANNRAACRRVRLRHGQQCDEFPLASTFQGAAFQPVFSAVAVPAAANSSQGGITSHFYTSNRVIDDDAFFVLAITASGAISWF